MQFTVEQRATQVWQVQPDSELQKLLTSSDCLKVVEQNVRLRLSSFLSGSFKDR